MMEEQIAIILKPELTIGVSQIFETKKFITNNFLLPLQNSIAFAN
jgi:hypothetical protein